MSPDSWDSPEGQTQSACECTESPGQCWNASVSYVCSNSDRWFWACEGCWAAIREDRGCTHGGLPLRELKPDTGWTLLHAMLGDRIKSEREARDLSQRAVAEWTGLSVTTVSRVERGEADNMGLGTFLALCGWLGMDPTVFLWLSVDGVTALDYKDLEDVEARLYADPSLPAESAKVMTSVLRALYSALRDKP